MIRLVFSSFKNCSNFKVLNCTEHYFFNLHSPSRTLTSRARVSHRKFTRVAVLKAKKSPNALNLTDSSKLGYRFRSSRPAAATSEVTAEDTDDGDDSSNSKSKSGKSAAPKTLPKVLINKSNNLTSQPRQKTSIRNFKSFKSAFASSPFGALIFPSTSNTSTSTELRILDDTYVPPKPLKLMDTVDPTVLISLYKAQQSPLALYMALSKFRLTSFVVITAATGYALGTGSFLSADLFWISFGTFMTSASANTFNQIIEVNYDKLMDRTKNRVLVQKLMSREHAMWFGVLSGLTGAAALYSVNELSAIIGVINLALYVGAYTPLKRKHIVNTWVGAVVGALPPLIGYAGATGLIDPKALVLSAIMFCWQFPHFNALSWNLRNDYDRAGYKMMCFANERLCRHTTLRYSLLLTAVCAASPLVGVSDWSFVLDSGVLNAYLCYLSWQFYKEPDAKSARKLFHYTLLHLPILIMFLVISNKAMKKTVTVAPVPVVTD